MSRCLLLAVALALALLVAGLALFWQPGAGEGSAGAGGDFVLQSADGPVALKNYRGKVVLLGFGYTSCPDVCPTTLAVMAEAVKLLTPAEAGRAALVFVSVDPERDPPARLKEYAAFFHPALVGLTGSAGEVAAVARQYGVRFARQTAATAGGYVIDHSADIYVIGADGVLAGRLPHAAPPSQVAAEIRKNLN